jgi:hypothetical protein
MLLFLVQWAVWLRKISRHTCNEGVFPDTVYGYDGKVLIKHDHMS